MGVNEIEGFLEEWWMGNKYVRRRMILAPTPRERERGHALWLLTQGWTASATAEALERDPHTTGRWVDTFGEGVIKDNWSCLKRQLFLPAILLDAGQLSHVGGHQT